MAFIDVKKIKRVEKDCNLIHKEVEASYSSFSSTNGTKYVQIDTYGTNDRLYRGKISQSIQIDKNSAEKLIQILKKEFGL
ncbi:hypothetical protein [Paucisalibacillus sp. EB02]|uniref:hypothetical protein n=1 Tax=Paucisalibacillus sp. EB02 TaxID=1347087 RepID=UPI0005A67517|nr:hypothetical protein [Paucisalibacillus sp. EB02]